MIAKRRENFPVQGKKSFFQTYFKLLVIGGSILVVLVIAGSYALWSNTSWGSYKARYEGWKGGFSTKLNDSLALKADTDQERADKLQSFKQVSSDLDAVQDGLCKPERLVAWQQQFMAAKKEDVVQCEGSLAKANSFKTALDTVVEYIENENTVAQKLRALPVSDKAVEEKDWEGHVTAWRMFSQELKDMVVSEAFSPTRQKTVESTELVLKAWDEVIAASKEKNKDRYTKAEETLAAAYDNLSGVSEVSAQQIKPLVEALEEMYRDVNL